MSRAPSIRKRHRVGIGVVLAAAGLVAGGLAAAGFGGPARIHAAPGTEVHDTMRSIVEIRSYNLRPGARRHFHRLVVEEAAPMLRRWDVDLVAHGPSPHDETSYYLIRAFADLDERRRSEDAFYGSAEWREGPRESILSLIENYTTIVLELDDATIEGLRASGRVYGDGETVELDGEW